VLSAAVGGYPARVADPVALLHEADRKMYEAKRRSPPVPRPRRLDFPDPF
jgi:hypothetical protein